MQRDTESCLRNDSHTEASWLHQRFGIQHTRAHTYAHLLTQGKEKYYIFIKARKIYARKTFISHSKTRRCFIPQSRQLLSVAPHPSSRAGHWAEGMSPSLVCVIQSGGNMRYLQRRKGKEGTIARRHFAEEITGTASRNFYIPHYISPTECQQSQPEQLTTFSVPLLQKNEKVCACGG